MRYTYSRWTGGHDLFDADQLIDALSDDLMSDGDLWNALQRVTRWGVQQDGEQRAPGLQSLLQRLRAQRQAELERYSLDSMIEDLQERIADVVQTERRGIERKVEEARAGADSGVEEMLESIAERKHSLLDSLPDEVGPAMTSLADYEFLDEESRAKFDALMETLKQQVLQTQFKTLEQTFGGLTDTDLGDLKAMVHDLSDLLEERRDGEEPDFERFQENHGRYFPEAETLDELLDQLGDQLAQMDSLLHSMSPDMRRKLEGMMDAVLRDDALMEELARMAELLQDVSAPGRDDYLFSGQQSLTFEEALRLMKRLQGLDQLEQELRRSQDTGNVSNVDSEEVRIHMGEDAYQAVERLKQLTEVLEAAGYIEHSGDSFELTARGVRRIGQKALQDIFLNLKRDTFGQHTVAVRGTGSDRSDDTKPYEFGDPFLLDLQQTLMNAVTRGGDGTPVDLQVGDFEVFRTEHLSQASTVLMLDMSRSMPLRGCFVAAKKVALALHSLIRTQFPRDHLYIIGFSDYARELNPERLHQITWGDYVYGTNMQHGFILARRLLGRHKASNKQIILITDGEPTAHFEADRVHFSYPPTFRTFQETLREVKRCTREDIVINTFMLERSHYLADFVNQLTRINRGRAFFATPERLGDYVLVDYVNRKRKLVA